MFRPETEVTLDKQTHVVAGVGFGGPLGATASLAVLHGLGARVRDGEDRVNVVCALPIPHCAQGFTLRADAGSGGGKLSLGIGARARVEEEDFRGTVGVGLRAVARPHLGLPDRHRAGPHLPGPRAGPGGDAREPHPGVSCGASRARGARRSCSAGASASGCRFARRTATQALPRARRTWPRAWRNVRRAAAA